MFKQKYKNNEIRKALETYSNVKSVRKAERICGISKSTIHRWWQALHSMMIRPKLQEKEKKTKNI